MKSWFISPLKQEIIFLHTQILEMKKTVIWFIFLIAILPVSLSKIHTQDDQYYASFGKIYHKLLSSNGQSFELQNTQQKLEVLWNDRLEPSEYATCLDQVGAKQTVKTAAYFEDATKVWLVLFYYFCFNALVPCVH